MDALFYFLIRYTIIVVHTPSPNQDLRFMVPPPSPDLPDSISVPTILVLLKLDTVLYYVTKP